MRQRPPGRIRQPGLAFLAAGSLAACAAGFPRPQPDRSPELRALLLNGGGTAQTNYHSHLVHLGSMYDTLTAGGLGPRQIAVLTSDGDSPEMDVAMSRSAQGPDAWLLDGTQLERPLAHPVRYHSTRSGTAKFRSARRSDLDSWFEEATEQLRSADTLLLFVTDHGEKGKTPDQNRITLWDRQSITVVELAAAIARLPAGVRVVTVMTQCFSGGFAEAALSPALTAGRRPGSTCGYFSTTADRPAYGCYPDADVEHDGYAIRIIQGLARTGSLPSAHDEALLTDRTPDVPLRTSDLYLTRLVDQTAGDRNTTSEQLVATLAAAALAADTPAARAVSQQVERLARSFAISVTGQPDEVKVLTERFAALGKRLDQSADSWQSAVHELAQANLDQFLAENRASARRLVPRELDRLNLENLEALQRQVVGDLASFTRRQPGRLERMREGEVQLVAVHAARTRNQVRAAAILRVRSLLTALVGRHLLDSEGTPAQQNELAALEACEMVRLPVPSPNRDPGPEPSALPSVESDERLAAIIAPASLGVALGELSVEDRARGKLPDGAMRVLAIARDSPAAAARLQVGDVVFGEVGAPATDRGSLKLQLAAGQSPVRALLVQRGGQALVVSVQPTRAGAGLPGHELPPAGRTALPSLKPLRGEVIPALEQRRPVLLFFWATWCTVCKLAVPELMALEKERGLSVLSITDESAPTIEGFLSGQNYLFPGLVARDPDRRVNEAFLVDGYPTFVLVDEHGRVRLHAVGYRPDIGLSIEGWNFSDRRPGRR